MDVDQLYYLTNWIAREVDEPGIPSTFSELATLLVHNANGYAEPFEEEKNKLLNAIGVVNLISLSDEQREYLDFLGLSDHLGKAGVRELEEILYINRLDVSTAAERINQISRDVELGVAKAEKIRSALLEAFDFDDQSQHLNDVRIRVSFHGDASIENIVDLKKWSAEWHDIGRGISMAVGGSPEDVRVIGARSGSVIVFLATTYAIAQVVSAILLKSLEVAQKTLDLQKKALEIEAMKLSNKQIADQIRDAAKQEREAGLDGISRALKDELRDLDGEKIEALDRAISKLLLFVERGGEVDLALPPAIDESLQHGDPSNSKAETARRLYKDVQRIRELEVEVKRLPPSNF